MCGNHLINNITPSSGLLCRGVLVTEELFFSDKYYLNLQYDRRTSNPVLLYSKVGGFPLDRLIKIDPKSIKNYQIDVN
jgi:succinyl-CoA synthetase beta subunit